MNTPVSVSQPRVTWGRWAVLGCTAVALGGCSVLSEDKVDYRSAKKASTLEVPPDLTQLSRDSRYLPPSASVSASRLPNNLPKAMAPEVVTTARPALVTLERAGSQRWLSVAQPPEKLWEPLRQFWQDSGFNLASEQANLGIMETEWAENRAKLPQDLVRATLGKVFDSLYSTGERDKFRTRIESNPTGGSDIYISHRGMVEVYNSAQKDSTVWQPRPSDTELEAEFLRRLMLKLGAPADTAKAAVSPPTAAAMATGVRPVSLNGQTVLPLNEGFDRAWRRVGLALDRSGFTVEDRDRNQGVYFVRYVPAQDQTVEKPGFFAGWFGGKKATDNTPQRYRVKVTATPNGSEVTVLDPQGQAASPQAGSQKILQLLATDLQ